MQILILFTLKNAIFWFLPLNLHFFCNFPPKMLILTIFFPKKCTFEKFSTSESEKYGEIFLPTKEEIKFLSRIFTYDKYLSKLTIWPINWGVFHHENSHKSLLPLFRRSLYLSETFSVPSPTLTLYQRLEQKRWI